MARATLAALLLLGLFLGGCVRGRQAPPSPAPPERVVLYLAADVRGYLGPCGCSLNMRGGLARAAFQLEEARRQGLPVLFLEGGNTLFAHPTLPASQVPQAEARARTLAAGLKAMGLSARAVGPTDGARGGDFLGQLALPAVGFGEGRVLPEAGGRVGVVAARTAEELGQGAARARAAGARFVLGLVPLSLSAAQRLVEGGAGGVDLVLAGASEGEAGGEDNRLVRGAVPVVAVQSKGRSLVRVDVGVGGEAGRFALQSGEAERERELAALEARLALLDREVNHPAIVPQLKALKQHKREELAARRQALATAPLPQLGPGDFTVRFVPLEASLPSSSAVEALVRAYDAEVGALNLAWARTHGEDCPPAPEGQARFVGNAECRTCHAQAFGVWEQSKHGQAWQTLTTLGKQHHLDCVGCHVTGWERPGGVCRLDRTEGRQDVGCESCHGPGSRHLEAPAADTIVGRPTAGVCTGCHTPENSPHFDFATYLPRVLGPGHGAAAAAGGR